MTDQILEFEIWSDEVTGRDALDIRPSWARDQTGQGLPLKIVDSLTIFNAFKTGQGLIASGPTLLLRLGRAKNTTPSPLESGFWEVF